MWSQDKVTLVIMVIACDYVIVYMKVLNNGGSVLLVSLVSLHHLFNSSTSF